MNFEPEFEGDDWPEDDIEEVLAAMNDAQCYACKAASVLIALLTEAWRGGWDPLRLVAGRMWPRPPVAPRRASSGAG